MISRRHEYYLLQRRLLNLHPCPHLGLLHYGYRHGAGAVVQ